MRLAPAALWSLSLAEWRALMPASRPALARRDLEALMQHYPDHPDAA